MAASPLSPRDEGRLKIKTIISQWKLGGGKDYPGLVRAILYGFIFPPSGWRRSFPCPTAIDTFSLTLPHADLFLNSAIDPRRLSAAIFDSLTDRERCFFLGVHPPSLSFSDEAIVGLIPLTPPEEGAPAYFRGKTPDGKVVFQQTAVRRALSAALAMLISDRLGRLSPPLWQIRSIDSAERELEEVGLKAVVSTTPASLDRLKMQLASFGPLTLSVHNGIPGQDIVIDSIEEVGAIRDPYHGWAVEISLEALLKSIQFVGVVTTIQLISSSEDQER